MSRAGAGGGRQREGGAGRAGRGGGRGAGPGAAERGGRRGRGRVRGARAAGLAPLPGSALRPGQPRGRAPSPLLPPEPETGEPGSRARSVRAAPGARAAGGLGRGDAQQRINPLGRRALLQRDVRGRGRAWGTEGGGGGRRPTSGLSEEAAARGAGAVLVPGRRRDRAGWRLPARLLSRGWGDPHAGP